MRRLSYNFSSAASGSKFLLLFGAPGVGKGTYAKMIAKDLGFDHISSGDLIRDAINNPNPKSEFSMELVTKTVRSGGLIPDEMVFELVKKRMGGTKRVILDGFPRTLPQLEILRKQVAIDAVLNITLKRDILLDKLLGRRVCSNCGAGYNVCDIDRDGYRMEAMPSKTEGVCDKCGGTIVKREDDNQHVIGARLQEYQEKSQPLLKVFQQMRVLLNIEPKNGVNDYHLMRELILPKLGVE